MAAQRGVAAARGCKIRAELLLALAAVVTAQTTCSTTVKQNHGMTYATCENLANGAQILWTLDNSTMILDATFIHAPQAPGGWVAWGISDLNQPHMCPGSALVCYPDANGTAIIQPYHLLEYVPQGVIPGEGTLDILDSACTIDSVANKYYLQFSLQLNQSETDIKSLYGQGPGQDPVAKVLQQHSIAPENNYVGLLNLVTGTTASVGDAHLDYKRTHGVLNAVGWGLLLPLGAMVARYMKPFVNPLWFYVHMSLQISGYAIGVVGFAFGLQLWEWSHDRRYHHRDLGIAIFAIATAQFVSIIFKPRPDHKLRILFNIYHHLGGYAVIVLSVVHIFIGFHILQNYGNWRTVYIVVISFLGGLALLLEAITWYVFFNRRSKATGEATEQPIQKGAPGYTNGASTAEIAPSQA